ncbi:MAG: sulfotransferase [Sphingobacteriales bacterium]
MSKSGYNFIDRFIHRVALQSKAVAEVSFDIEEALTKKKGSAFPGDHVFISGLARSGTTILMQYLYGTGQFRSLTYRDMPFVLMPGTWKKIATRTSSVKYKERAHLDNIKIGIDSPEAFEEVFWRVFCGKQYILKDRLLLHKVGDRVLEKFRAYVNNILLSRDTAEQSRYLSKNNNNVLRFDSLRKCFPDAHIIIPFREPLQHAISLLNQQIHFSKIQQEDSFSLDYMNWLGHFEFGLNQKSFFLNDEETFREIGRYAKTDINFWLLNWKNYYRYVSDHHTPNTIFFNYDKFCQSPASELSGLFKKINVNAASIRFEPFNMQVKTIEGYDKSLLEECEVIYKQLEDKAGL